MSMHKIPLTPLEEEGLLLHGLPIGTPSQRSDTFRQGVAWGIGEAKRLTEENERLRKDAERYRWLIDQHWIQSEVDWRLIPTHQESTIEQLSKAIDAARGVK